MNRNPSNSLSHRSTGYVRRENTLARNIHISGKVGDAADLDVYELSVLKSFKQCYLSTAVLLG